MARETYVIRDGKLIEKHLAPPRGSRASGLQVIKDIEPYQAIAVDGRVISGRRQHREMLKAHGLVELGTDAPTRPPERPRERVDASLVQHIKHAMGKL